ncbi:uncharacterized protein LOC129568996 [Sitodiplosis mosellana]|uniref:uncharacterized protein LOC129568996 n=1 Tax=Sitodiplosis mosellana TaxID=263140 RepID=UPI002443D318|nr:uncharacterized protein LOC129568996 [Sitodiplosis mosellana]XP_055303342.1 uncharacterized protein LOC129568996 [Sitodiplosis mosellana]
MSDPKNRSECAEQKLSAEEQQMQEKVDPLNSSNDTLDSPKNEKNSSVTAVLRKPLNQQSRSQIFKLTIDCFEEIFEYLSMKDLHSFGQTCKTIQQIVGGYFRQSHWAAETFIENDGISVFYADNEGAINDRMLTTVFNAFITNISYSGVLKEPLFYIESHCEEFKSVNYIYLESLMLQNTELKHFKHLLPNIETIQIRNCTIDGDFHDILLNFCPKMKRLYLQDSHLGNKWLQQSYPMLEYLELNPIPALATPNELDHFFDQNPTVKICSTSAYSLWLNRHTILESKIKLDVLEVKIYGYYTVVTNVGGNKNEANGGNNDDDDDDYNDDEDNEIPDSEDESDQDTLTIQSLCTLLNQLHGRFFKRLHFYMPKVTQKNSDYVIKLQGLEKLCIQQFSESYSLAHLIGLKELAILDGANPNDMEILANNYVNLQYLYMRNVTYDALLPFIRRSTKLKCVKLFPKDKSSFNGDFLNIVQLNEERVKLEKARKVIIYVPDNVFLTSKWTLSNGDTNLQLIEMKRSDSQEWNHHY